MRWVLRQKIKMRITEALAVSVILNGKHCCMYCYANSVTN